MPSDLRAILKLEVPVIVVLGSRDMPLAEVTSLIPGAIIEIPKQSEEELELLVNNKVIGTGRAVKVGENFGLRITFIGDLRSRVAALGSNATPVATVPEGDDATATKPMPAASSEPTTKADAPSPAMAA